MSKNYYEILDVKRNCSDLDITRAYKKLSLRYHPSRSKEDKVASSYLFEEITEAYEVLSDYKKRSCYDQVGEFGLKQGGPDGRGGYRYLTNSEEIFQNFFKSNDPLEALFGMAEVEGSLFGSALRGMSHLPAPPPGPLEISVPCTLEELYNGCSKVITFQRNVLNSDKVTTTAHTATRHLDIRKGSVGGNKIVFPGEGHMAGQHPTGDLVAIIVEETHLRFKRDGDNLEYRHKLRLAECLMALPVEVETLDKRVITISFQEIVNPDTVKIIEGEGMPIVGGTEGSRGELVVRFDVKFPKHITEEKKRRAIELLS